MRLVLIIACLVLSMPAFAESMASHESHTSSPPAHGHDNIGPNPPDTAHCSDCGYLPGHGWVQPQPGPLINR